MATINLGAIKFNWKGAYNSSTSYAVDDVVSSGGNSYVCIQAHSNQAVGNATAYWNIMATKGTNGTDGTDADLLSIGSTAQGDLYYNSGSAIARLGAGTSGQYLETKGTGQNPVWSTVSAGTYSVHAMSQYVNTTGLSHGGSAQAYVDIAHGNTLNFTPTSTSDIIEIFHSNAVETSSTDTGLDVYIMMKAGSSSIGSGDTKLNYDGNHTFYGGQSQLYGFMSKKFFLPCTALSTSTTYYIEQAGATHNNNTCNFNRSNGSASGDYRAHVVSLIHWKA